MKYTPGGIQQACNEYTDQQYYLSQERDAAYAQGRKDEAESRRLKQTEAASYEDAEAALAVACTGGDVVGPAQMQRALNSFLASRSPRSMDWESALKLASKAVYDTDGRGMVGAGRMDITNRVARAIFRAAAPTGEGA